jgi:prepilin-type N-terminal cleavage/methylation domain-containing protein
MMKNQTKGFTLIEILIVVAIIAILASVVLVGLGPTQSLGRDARRVSDLHEVQNGLELYYNKNGAYPIPTTLTWGPQSTPTTLSGMLAGAGVGITNIPNDPNSNGNYIYAWTANGVSYVLAGLLENGTGGSWNGYTFTLPAIAGETGGTAPACPAAGAAAVTIGQQTGFEYCISL